MAPAYLATDGSCRAYLSISPKALMTGCCHGPSSCIELLPGGPRASSPSLTATATQPR